MTSQRKARQEAEAQQARESVTLSHAWEKYAAIAKANKPPRTIRNEEHCFRLWISPAIGFKPFRDIAPIQRLYPPIRSVRPPGMQSLRLLQDRPHGGVLEVRRVAVFPKDALDQDPHFSSGALAVRPVHGHVAPQAGQ